MISLPRGPCTHYLYHLSFKGHWEAGTNPSWHLARGGVAGVSRQRQSETNHHIHTSWSPISLWTVGGRRRTREITHTDTGRTCQLHTEVLGIEPGTFLLCTCYYYQVSYFIFNRLEVGMIKGNVVKCVKWEFRDILIPIHSECETYNWSLCPWLCIWHTKCSVLLTLLPLLRFVYPGQTAAVYQKQLYEVLKMPHCPFEILKTSSRENINKMQNLFKRVCFHLPSFCLLCCNSELLSLGFVGHHL